MDEYNYFHFFDYSFSNDTYDLLNYLDSKEIKYIHKKDFIIFKLNIEGYKYSFKIKAFKRDDNISSIQIIYPVKIYNDGVKIKEELNAKYKYIHKNSYFEDVFHEDPIYIYLKNDGETAKITVNFGSFDVSSSERTENINFKWLISLSIIGLVLSITAFIINFNYNDLFWLKFLLGIICFIYGYYELYKAWLNETTWSGIKKILVGLACGFGYILVVFLVICIGALWLKLGFDINYLFCVIYTIPSFAMVICILMLLMMAASYA